MKEKKAVFKRMRERKRISAMKIVVEAGWKERMREKRTLKYKGKFFFENQKKTRIVGKRKNTRANE